MTPLSNDEAEEAVRQDLKTVYGGDLWPEQRPAAPAPEKKPRHRRIIAETMKFVHDDSTLTHMPLSKRYFPVKRVIRTDNPGEDL